MSSVRLVLRAKRALTASGPVEDAEIVISGGRIERIGPAARAAGAGAAQVLDLGEATLAPGFVDVHIHGGGGVRGGDSREALASVARGLARQGTTSFLPTLGGVADFERLLDQLRMVSGALGARTGGAEVVGIHLEGPFLSPDERARGSQNVAAMRTPSVEEFDRMADAAGGALRYMTIAPELPGALDVIERMRVRGVTPAAGHTTATYEQMVEAIRRGLSSVCHTYNGMPSLHHREPGVVGAALVRSELTCELIADGHHVSPVAMEILYRMKGIDKIALVTDNTQWAGLPDGRYERPGGRVVIKQGGKCWVEGGRLAGSAAPMNQMVRTFMEATGCTLVDAVRAASLNPARLVGIDERKGSLEEGKDADVIALDEQLNVRLTVVGGEVVYRS